MSTKEFLVLLLVCFLWGLHFVVMKLTVNTVADPLFYAAIRISLVALILAPRLKWHTGQMHIVLLAGLGYGALNYAFMFPALGMTTASAAAITIELYVPFSIILSILVFKDRIGIFRIFGICLAFLGVAIVASAKPDEAAGPYFVIGIAMMACAAMCEALGAIFVKKTKGINPLDLLAWFAVVGTCVLWPLSLLTESDQLRAFSPETRIPFLMAVAYSALFVSIVAHGSYYWLLQRLPIYLVATSGLMTTVFAVGLSALILSEPLSIQLMVGAVLTLAGVGLILARNRKTLTQERSPETPEFMP